MPTVLAFLDDNGKRRKCGARCYTAKNPRANCNCVCGGRNHGAGETQAILNVKDSEREVKIIPERSPKRKNESQMDLLESLEEAAESCQAPKPLISLHRIAIELA